jgi:hypothetical protein
MRIHPLVAVMNVAAISMAGGSLARVEDDEPTKRDDKPREPRAAKSEPAPKPALTDADHERIRRAEMKRARKAERLAALAAAQSEGDSRAA